MTGLSQLIDKLEKAEAGSRELDVVVAQAIGASVRCSTITETRYQIFWPDAEFGQGDDPENLPELPQFTTSLDAAIALVKRVLPEGTWSIDQHRSEKCYAGVRQDDWTPPVHGFGWSPALALCTALLKALHAKEQAR